MSVSPITPELVTLKEARDYLSEQQIDQDNTGNLQTIINSVTGWIYRWTGRKRLLVTEPQSSTIVSVTAHFRVRYSNTNPFTQSADPLVIIDGTTYAGTGVTLTADWVDRSAVWTTSPATDNAWTWAEVEAMTGGVRLIALSTGELNAECSQLYFEVLFEDGTLNSTATLRPASDVSAGTDIVAVPVTVTELFRLLNEATADDTTYISAQAHAGNGFSVSADYIATLTETIPYGSITEYVRGRGDNQIQLAEQPVTSIAEVQIYPNHDSLGEVLAGPGTARYNDDMWTDAETGQIFLKNNNLPDIPSAVLVTYIAGFAADSAEAALLKGVALELVAFHWARYRTADQGIANHKKGDETVTYRDQDIDPAIKRQLNEFRRRWTA